MSRIVRTFFDFNNGYNDGTLADHVAVCQAILTEYPDAVVRFSIGDDAWHVYSSEDAYQRNDRKAMLEKEWRKAQDAADAFKKKLDEYEP